MKSLAMGSWMVPLGSVWVMLTFSVLVELLVPSQPGRVAARRYPKCCSRTGRIDSSRGRCSRGDRPRHGPGGPGDGGVRSRAEGVRIGGHGAKPTGHASLLQTSA